MGKGMTGGVLAAPIFTEFMTTALKDAPPKEFQVPPGIELIPIDRRTGLRAQAGGDGVILEAFKPGKGPPLAFAMIGNRKASRSTRRAVVRIKRDHVLRETPRYRELPNGVIIKLR
jgi:penicillin-binding protein 1A